jgi:hypothetical protein
MDASTTLLFWFWQEPEHPDSVVYFARNPRGGAVKIGRTENLPERMSTLRTAIPDPELVGHIPGGRRAERDLQQTFAHLSIGGEWFQPDLRMAHTIAALVTSARTEQAS